MKWEGLGAFPEEGGGGQWGSVKGTGRCTGLVLSGEGRDRFESHHGHRTALVVQVCTSLATVFSFLKRLMCRPCQERKLTGDRVALPIAVNHASVPKETDTEEWTSWDEAVHTRIKTEEGMGV